MLVSNGRSYKAMCFIQYSTLSGEYNLKHGKLNRPSTMDTRIGLNVTGRKYYTCSISPIYQLDIFDSSV